MRVECEFQSCVQDAQELGSNDDYMISRVNFWIGFEGRRFDDLYCTVKQVTGSDYATTPLEVGRPVGYSGPLNYEQFRDAAERYYRSLVGSSGSLIGQGPRARSARMINNLLVKRQYFQMEVDDSLRGAW